MNDSVKHPLSARFRGYFPVVIDVETAGFNAQTDALLEIAASVLTLDEVTGKLSIDETIQFNVHPFEGANLEPKALEFTGIDTNRVHHVHNFCETISAKQFLRNNFCETISAKQQFLQNNFCATTISVKQTISAKQFLRGNAAIKGRSILSSANLIVRTKITNED